MVSCFASCPTGSGTDSFADFSPGAGVASPLSFFFPVSFFFSVFAESLALSSFLAASTLLPMARAARMVRDLRNQLMDLFQLFQQRGQLRERNLIGSVRERLGRILVG